MAKGVAPTELKQDVTLAFYKGNTPTEFSALAIFNNKPRKTPPCRNAGN